MEISKYKPSEIQSHLDHVIFEDWASVPIIRIIKVLSGRSGELYNQRAIAIMIGNCVGSVNRSLKILQEHGYISVTKDGKYKLKQRPAISVHLNEHSNDNLVHLDEHRVHQNEQTVHLNEHSSVHQNERTNIYYNISNISKNDLIGTEVPQTHTESKEVVVSKSKKGSTLFRKETSITKEQYQSILADLCEGDKNFLKECVLEMEDWSQSGHKLKHSWSATLRNWIRRKKTSGGMPWGRVSKDRRPVTFREAQDAWQKEQWGSFLNKNDDKE